MIGEDRICQANLAREGLFLFGKNCLGGLILPSKFGPITKIVRTKSVLGPNLTRTVSAVTDPLSACTRIGVWGTRLRRSYNTATDCIYSSLTHLLSYHLLS